jgi:hypothetical protein
MLLLEVFALSIKSQDLIRPPLLNQSTCVAGLLSSHSMRIFVLINTCCSYLCYLRQPLLLEDVLIDAPHPITSVQPPYPT